MYIWQMIGIPALQGIGAQLNDTTSVNKTHLIIMWIEKI